MIDRITWIGAAFLLLVPGTGFAGVDGGKPMLCAVTEAVQCVYEEECSSGSAESVNVPNFVRIDPKGKTLSEYKGTRESPVQTVFERDGRIILQGFEERAWSISISKDSGRLTATATGPDAGFVLFGVCTDL